MANEPSKNETSNKPEDKVEGASGPTGGTGATGATGSTPAADPKANEQRNDEPKAQESQLNDDQVGAGAPAGNVPDAKDMLESAGTASPHAPNAGLDDGTRPRKQPQ
jgi:hypothetical protein